MAKYHIADKADLGILYDAMQSRVDARTWQKASQNRVSRDDFVRFCAAQAYPTLGICCDGEPVGGLVFDGQAVHIEVLPEHHGRWGFVWKQCLQWAFSNKDPIEVKLFAGDEKAHRFMQRNNWQRIHADEDFVTYRMSSQDPPHYATRNRKR